MAGASRMDREQFAAATAGLGEAELRKALWTVYWRGTAAVRERIEDILAPDTAPAGRRAPQVPEPGGVLAAVQEFTALVRSGAYLAGSRAVRPKERSGWRFTFRRLLTESRTALKAADPAPGQAALTAMIDLGCELRDYDYFRSQDPIEAAAVVISDEADVLWRHILGLHGFDGLAATAANQLLRWESRFGWTRSGWGTISARERQLADVLADLLTVPDTWVTFTEHYLQALDDLLPPPAPPEATRGRPQSSAASQGRRAPDQRAARRAETMIGWHLILLTQFTGTQDDALLDRLAGHAALGGPEHTYFTARLAHARNDLPAARSLIQQGLDVLPGHAALLALARETGTPLPARAAAVAASRRPRPPANEQTTRPTSTRT